jgi:hypothetical protein
MTHPKRCAQHDRSPVTVPVFAHGPRPTREDDDVVLAAIIAVQMREAPRENSAVEAFVWLLLHKFRQRAPTGLVGPLLFEGQQVPLPPRWRLIGDWLTEGASWSA